MRFKAKTDDNQTEIVSALRKIGCSVVSLAAVGKGCPDILVGYAGRYGRKNILMEIKDGTKPPSKRKLTPDQVDFHQTWRGQIAVVSSVKEAVKCLKQP